MVVDASAIIAILRAEPESDAFKRALALAPVLHISPVNWFEAALNTENTPQDAAAFKTLSDYLGLVIVPVDEAQMRIAHQAWKRFGKGRDPARLNMGDCFAYALAKQLGEPLLFKGNDFAKTDVVSAV
ncbi:MAG TPA: type II toxin-antitoxin system VapC family toxin [Rhizomicrobium sp.]|jgi:ribonuclease VapC